MINNLSIYHITWVTYNSRVSERMKLYSKKRNRFSIILDDQQEVEVTKHICKIVIEDKLNIISYNICSDLVHLILICEKSQRDNIVRKLKGKSTQLYKSENNISSTFHLWAQKYNFELIDNYLQLINTIVYIKINRAKHNLPENKGLQPLVHKMISNLKNSETLF